MELDNRELMLGKLWFFGAGACAVCLAIFVARTDLRLTYSDSEKVKGREIKEVRVAQASLPTDTQDPRLKKNLPKSNLVAVSTYSDDHSDH